MIQVVILRPHRTPQITEIEDDVLAYQKIVDGYIEAVSIGNELTALVNEDGKMLGMSPNFDIGYTTLVGNVIVVRDRGGVSYESLSAPQIKEVLRIYEEGKIL